MTQDQIIKASYRAENIAKAMDRAWWLAEYSGGCAQYSPYHVEMGRMAFSDLAAAMGYTIALIEATDAEVIE